MKLHRSTVAVCAAAALTFALPTAAHAAPAKAKGKAAAAQQQKAGKAKAEAARKKAEAARKKAAEARSRFTFPGTVTAVSPTGLSITRKERGVTVVRAFVLAPHAVVKRDGVRIPLSAVGVGDKVTAQGRRVDGVLTVEKLNVAAGTVTTPAPAPVVPDSATATILI